MNTNDLNQYNQYKVLSVNPGSSDRIPVYNPASEETPSSIVPWSDRMASIIDGTSPKYMQGSASRLLLRIVAALIIGGSAWMQMRGYICVFGIETQAYAWGVGALVLCILMLMGAIGRMAPLCLAALAVVQLVSYAYNNGGVADFSPSNQLALVYGALAAVVAVLGPGRLTLPIWLENKFSRR